MLCLVVISSIVLRDITRVVKIRTGRVIMSNHENEPGHGNSVAAWAAVITAIVGVSVATLGVVLPEGSLVAIGAVLTVLSIPMGPVLVKLGYGISSTNPKK
jgi:hypothetical protein